ncbi:hypothetical protein PS15p_208326 [Mucor circinelloides]
MTTSEITQTPEAPVTINTNLAYSHRANEKLPRYHEGDNLQTFFKLYELTAHLNGWETCQDKLAHVHNSFKGKLLEWVVGQSWEAWDEFKTSLMERQEVTTKDDMYYLTKLLQTKRKGFASLNKFILKFDSLMQARKSVQAKNSDVVTDLDPFYMKLFVKNSSPAEMRRYLKEKQCTKLSELYKLARSYEGEDSSDDDSDSGSNSNVSEMQGSSDSDSDSHHYKPTKSKSKRHSMMVKSGLPKLKDTKEPSFKTALLAVLDQQQQQQFMLLLQQQTQQTITPPRARHNSYRCYNCKEPGHFDDQCPEPCKHCGSRDHRRYQCPQKPSNCQSGQSGQSAQPSQAHNNGTAASPSRLFMQIAEDDYALQQKLCHPDEGDLLAMKRLRNETQKEKDDQTAKKAKYKANREAKRVAKMQVMINQEKMQKAGPCRLANASDITTGDPSTSAAVDNQFNDTVSPMQSSCEPLPTEDAMQTSTINSMDHQEMVNVSSPKSPIVSLPRNESHHQVLPDPLQVKPSVNVILDTGCTPCVISHQLVQKLGLAEQMVMLPKSSHGGVILVGDERRVQIKGIIKDLKLQLLPGHDMLVDAVCLDVADCAYEFLCGRIVMAKFGICVDLGTTSSWFIRNGKDLEEPDVVYTAPEVAEELDTCYLVNIQSTQPGDDPPLHPEPWVREGPSSKPSGSEIFEKLFLDIDANPLLSKEQKPKSNN